ncbi:tRNA (adenine(58)-N(1))-methyltransferase non-catalytic subunit TRM6 [Chelonus insularis]|uniref:tRNA (adenine(58)-N(1))-methyltransferase non-catalytic subunit TRM6 n=1 Tax=Chelonus insularis TaxID=460826 RepID=UPI00158B0395|nr:tRNA (adenine(58)-N(1))-methyltransferase non-catalytic subunit TRM6 [Chelonus insularis]
MYPEIKEEIVNTGNYVVVQRQNFRKLCKITKDGTFTLNKKQIEVNEIIGKPYWTTFKMIPSNKGKNNMALEVVERAETSEDLKKGLISGVDNRSITDDGTSQKLSKEDILDLKEAGKSSNEIVGCLIENSSSFISKTEYSQEKYIKKKETKYYKYLTILKPTICLLQEIYFKQDHGKINCIRMDTLSQILSYCDVKADGQYLLYDGGSAGLVTAALLNRIGAQTEGTLINIHPGNHPNLTLVLAMNFPEEQLNRLQSVNLYTFLRLYHQGIEVVEAGLTKMYSENKKSVDNMKRTHSDSEDDNSTTKKIKLEDLSSEKKEALESKEDNQKTSTNNSVIFKKPKWLCETQKVVESLKVSKVEGLAVIAKEHPLNIVNALLTFLGTSKPFVIYHCYREPLQETYVALKQRKDVINLKLFSNFFRGYQVLPNRTHPEITTNDLGGYLLSGYLVN